MKKIRIGFKIIKTIDLFGEFFTFGQRLALNKAFQSDSHFECLKNIILILHDITIKPRHVPKLIGYYKDILQKMEKWMQREQSIHYTPTAEEKQAGYDNVYKELGDFSVVDSIALRITKTHDDVLAMPYSTVFLMLKKDFHQARLERNLNKIHERKWK